MAGQRNSASAVAALHAAAARVVALEHPGLRRTLPQQAAEGFLRLRRRGQLSMLALLFALAWMNDRNGAYVVGGSQAIIRLIRERLDELGGHLGLGPQLIEPFADQPYDRLRAADDVS